MRSLAVVAGVAALLMVATAASAELEVGWKGSTYFKDTDAGYAIKIGGRIMNDWYWNNADAALDSAITGVVDGVIFRRARLFSSGDIHHNVFYKVQFDFAGGDADFKDVFIGLKRIPYIDKILVGHQYEPAGLETITSSKNITFLERASVSTLMPERHTGIAQSRVWNQSKVTVSVGAFQSSDNYGNALGDDYAYTGRVTWAPTNEDAGKKLIHVGASASYRNSKDGVFQVTARPENPLAPSFLNTDEIAADTYSLFGGEFIGNWGPFSVQGEAALSQLKGQIETEVAPADTQMVDVSPNFGAYYVQASYFLTGEHRGYKHGKGDGVSPNKNFDGKSGGAGAWELAARWSSLDLNDDLIQGGEFNIFTAGINWYLNKYTRVMFNYSYTDYTSVGTMNAFATRFQISF